jgi:Zn-dependent protease
MLFLLSDLSDDPVLMIQVVLAFIAALLTALTFHEASHAFVAQRLGDPTAKNMGRVSLDPRRHLDPAGTLLFVFAGFGWGKPVPVDGRFLRGGRQAMGLVSLAGPGANFSVALVTAIVVQLTGLTPEYSTDIGGVGDWLGLLASNLIFYNLLLGFFNLVPLAPLDGSKVAIGFAPPNIAATLARTERYGPGVLMIIIMADIGLRIGILRTFLFPPVEFFYRLLVGSG